MLENADALYAAFRAKDPRFDGRVFVGVRTTGIYCRPVCRAKQAARENCTFYASAAQAELAGYRPCLLCRPELAPGRSCQDASARMAVNAARIIDETCGEDLGLGEVARKLGISDRHLRRVFLDEFGVPPVHYLQTARLLAAKGLLTDTGLPVLEVAMASGFGSLRRFNELFRTRYGLAPTELRRRLPGGSGSAASVTVRLGYRPPYRWDAMLAFLEKRAIAGVETVRDGEYLRTVRLRSRNSGTSWEASGWLRVGNLPGKSSLAVTVSESLLPVMPQVLSRVRRLFDLHCDPDAVYRTLEPMNLVAPGLCVPGTRVPGAFDPFETAVRAVLGQQITVRAAGTLAGRIAGELGEPVDTGMEGLSRVFPDPEILAIPDPESPVSTEDRLGALGIIGSRSRAIVGLAAAVVWGKLDLDLLGDPADETVKLTSVRGIGGWTAGYMGMRAGGWPDVFLESDAGIRKALPGRTPRELLALSEKWSPWRSYATVNLWNSLQEAKT
jgi:AraC family transcriptional regulator of adaptative response / DNA-3-methyladenine glycosylase II